MTNNPKHLLDFHKIVPKKSLGQNFLGDPGALERIVEAAEIAPGETVLEIGPGTGALTVLLVERAEKLVLVELDTRLIPLLRQQFEHLPHVQIIHGDIMTQNIGELVGSPPYSVVANLPYYITSAILRLLLEDTPHKPRRLVLTVQLEVAERLTARPGDHSLLSMSVAYFAETKLVSKLRAGAFYPRPDVDSAIIRLDVHPTPPVDVPGEAIFFRVLKAGFSQKRKQLKNALGGGLAIGADAAAALLERAQIDPTRRAETLILPEWARIAHAYADTSRTEDKGLRTE